MDPKFRSSFIPKKPLSTKAEGSRIKSRRSFNATVFLASAIFLAGVLGSAGVFGWKFYLQDQIDQKGVQLTEARALLNVQQIDNFKLLDERLSAAWGLLRGHKATSEVFNALEANTLHNVQFDSYEFGDGLKVTLTGRAQTFNSLALQSDVFENLKLFKNTKYSQFSVDPDTNQVEFSIETELDPNEIKYMKP